MQKVGWKSIAPIFADVMVSPWNLLVGGLLIQNLSTDQTIVALLCGYAILSAIFIFYGGLGFSQKKQSAEILTSVFGSKVTRYAIPMLLAIGQIGWASINIELGGKSLAYVFSSPDIVGLILYGLFLVGIAALDLYKMGIIKFLITVSSVSLLGYTFISKVIQTPLSTFWAYKADGHQSLFWGISIVVASLISFSTVTPDFFMSVRSKKDIIISTFLGLFIPGILTALLGSFLFFSTKNYNLIALISSLTFPLFPHILNACTNTDGSIAIYTPGLKFQAMFGIPLKRAIIFAGCMSFILALFQISSHLEEWLKTLSLLFPGLIGVTLTPFLIERRYKMLFKQTTACWLYIIPTVCSLPFIRVFPPVIFVLLLPSFLLSFYGSIRSVLSKKY